MAELHEITIIVRKLITTICHRCHDLLVSFLKQELLEVVIIDISHCMNLLPQWRAVEDRAHKLSLVLSAAA